MVRYNSNANYGATNSAHPPPPYSGFTPPSGSPQRNDWSPVDPPRSPFEPSSNVKRSAWNNTLSFVALLTFVITVGLCMITMPVTYCNDPADPRVRERVREEWSKELLEHEKYVQARWAWEDERHAAVLRRWDQERIQHERELKERARREEKEREEEHQRLHMFWGHAEAHTCTTYATREYTAQLMNLPITWTHRLDACRATPLEIHGISYLPTTCEDRGPGVVVGRWEINQQEPDCKTFWDSHNDKGCTSPGSGKKYITRKLENLPEKSDWREFCATTPAYFDHMHMHFPGAQECIQSVWGVYGQWEIDDSNC